MSNEKEQKGLVVKEVTSVKPSPVEAPTPPFPVFRKDLTKISDDDLMRAHEMFNRTVTAMKEYGADGWYNGTVHVGHCVAGHMYHTKHHDQNGNLVQNSQRVRHVEQLLHSVGLKISDLVGFNDHSKNTYSEALNCVRFWRDGVAAEVRRRQVEAHEKMMAEAKKDMEMRKARTEK